MLLSECQPRVHRPGSMPNTIAVAAMGGGSRTTTDAHPAGLPAILAQLVGQRLRVAHLGTASGESRESEQAVEELFGRVSEQVDDIAHARILGSAAERRRSLRYLAGANLVYVSGGNTALALQAWRKHHADDMLRQLSRHGVLMSGSSAGVLCWFDACVTDSFGAARVIDALGFIPGIACAHYGEFQDGRKLLRRVARGYPTPSLGIADGSLILYSQSCGYNAINLGVHRSVELQLKGEVIAEVPLKSITLDVVRMGRKAGRR